MDATQIISVSLAVTGVLVGVAMKFKYAPGQRETTEANVAQSMLNIAQGTVEMVTSKFEQELVRMEKKLQAQEEAHARAQERARTSAAELQHELDEALKEIRTLRVSLRDAWREVEACRLRCRELEQQLNA